MLNKLASKARPLLLFVKRPTTIFIPLLHTETQFSE